MFPASSCKITQIRDRLQIFWIINRRGDNIAPGKSNSKLSSDCDTNSLVKKKSLMWIVFDR